MTESNTSRWSRSDSPARKVSSQHPHSSHPALRMHTVATWRRIRPSRCTHSHLLPESFLLPRAHACSIASPGPGMIRRLLSVRGRCSMPHLYRQHLTVRTRALFLASHARMPDVITRLARGLDDLFVGHKSHFIMGHVFVERSFDPDSSHFLITYCLTDATCCLTDATDWNQIKPLCNSDLVWTVWPTGRSDSKHRL